MHPFSFASLTHRIRFLLRTKHEANDLTSDGGKGHATMLEI